MISDQDRRWEISSTLTSKGFVHCGPGPDQYRGQLKVGHLDVAVEVNIADLNFVLLPRIKVLDREKLPLDVIAHLETGTGLCYAERALLRLDPYSPGASVLRVLSEAEETLKRSLANRARTEIALELPRYWDGLPALVLLPEEGNESRAKLVFLQGDNAPDLPLLVPATSKAIEDSKVNCDALVVRVSGDLMPGKRHLKPATLPQLESWLAEQAGGPPMSFERILEACARGSMIFFRGQNGWVGCRAELPADLHKLGRKSSPNFRVLARALRRRSEAGKGIALTRYVGHQADLTYMTARNLREQSSPLKGKAIAVVGCGAVGSHLARYLVQIGAGNGTNLIVLDNDVLWPSNLGRHLLNFADLGKDKAVALAEELRRFHPDVMVRPIVADVARSWAKISHCDLIIDAAGVETVSEFLNSSALEKRQSASAALLHVWLFNNGIAAQTFLNSGGGHACYRCLRPDLKQPWKTDPRKELSQKPSIRPASCSDGPYLPFAVSAPVTGAALALDAILDFFSGKPGLRFRSRVLNADEAKKTNDRNYEKDSSCPACGAG